MNKLSIIIPFKNIETKYLEKICWCLQNQTNKNFETIFIDDNSNNNVNYKSIIKNNKFKYIKRTSPSNLGLARDYGVNIATGKYISFIDCDDLISTDYVEYILNSFERFKNVDVIFFKYKRIKKYKDLKKIKIYKKYKEKEITNDIWKIHNHFIDDIRPDWLCCMKKKFIEKNNIFHSSKVIFFEDIFYNVITLSKLTNCLLTTKIIYFYNRLNLDSILNTIKEKDFCLNTINAVTESIKYLENQKIPNKIINNLIVPYFYIFFQFKFNFKERLNIYKKYTKGIKLSLFFKIKFSRDWILINFGWIVWIIFGTIFFGKKYQ